MGAPLVYGLEAVGTLPEVRAAGFDFAVLSFEPGWRGRIGGADTVIVPQPPAPQNSPGRVDPEVATLSPEEMNAWMLQLAEDGMGACEDGTRPDLQDG